MRSVLVIAVAANLRRLRAACGWSQEDLADRCGLHRTYVGAIERGERNLTLGTLERLAVALQVTPTELLLQSRRRTGRTR
jgi:transcriptional regulator with XRE-family HTH domain